MKSGVSESTFSASSNAIKLLANRRYAFLMAFHPRLGQRFDIFLLLQLALAEKGKKS